MGLREHLYKFNPANMIWCNYVLSIQISPGVIQQKSRCIVLKANN